jgi:hypothetical protein
MSGLRIESVEEVNTILKEVTEFTIRGLLEPDVRAKQFYLERIYISLGMSLADIRNKFPADVIIGINPEAKP